MALFDESTITDSGVELLNAQLAGQRLTVTSAYAGTGCVDKDLLHAQTDLVDQRQKTVLVSLESYEDHKRIRVQISTPDFRRGTSSSSCSSTPFWTVRKTARKRLCSSCRTPRASICRPRRKAPALSWKCTVYCW